MESQDLPEHLRHWGGLYERKGESIVDASPQDVAVAKAYPFFADKGEWQDDLRITIMTEKTSYRIGEEVRVLHAVESIKEDGLLYIMGPKMIYDQYVNGELTTEKTPEYQTDPLVPLIYDGAVESAPALDYNYDISLYTFDKPGEYVIQWKPGTLRSNLIRIRVKQTQRK